MKRFKIVKHYYSANDFMYGVYERYSLFFWKYFGGFETIEKAEHNIKSKIAYEKEQADLKRNTPKNKVVKYV